MKKLRSIVEDIFVSANLGAFDFDSVKECQINVVINLVSDEEAGVFGNATALKLAAQRADIAFYHLPVSPADILEPEFTKDFGAIFSSVDGRILVNCKSGTRAALAIANQMACSTQPEDLLNIMDANGFDFAFLQDEFQDRFTRYNSKAPMPSRNVTRKNRNGVSACA